MIKSIKVKNVSSIYEMVEISFVKGEYKFRAENNIMNNIVSPSLVVGGNGTGKSTLLKVFNDIRELTSRVPVGKVITPNFFNSKESRYEESFIEVVFVLREEEYKYGIKINNERIMNEKTFITEEYLFIGESKDNILDDEDHVSDKKLVTTLSVLRDTTENEYVTNAFNFLNEIIFIDSKEKVCISDESFDKGESLVKYQEQIKELLINEFDDYNLPLVKSINKRETLDESVSITINDKVDDLSFKFDSRFFSNGTRKIYNILATMLFYNEKKNAKNTSKLLVIDELDNALHISTLRAFLKVAHKNNIQIIFSTHKTSIMNEMRPDQVYISRYDNKEYQSKYRRGSDIDGIRELHNMEKIYLSRKFMEDNFEF